MKWLTHIVAAFTVAAIFGLIFTEVIDHTVLSSNYLEHKATQVNAYDRLVSSIDSQLTKQVPADQAVAIKALITPTLVKQQINSALKQFELYYKGSGTMPPTIDISGLLAQARAARLQIPSSQFDKPVTLASNPKAKNIGSGFENLKLGYMIVSLAFLGLLLFLSWERHRWATLPDIAIVCGLLVGIVALIIALVPDAANHFTKLNLNSNAFTSLVHDLAMAVTRNLSEIFGTIAAVLFIIGLASRLLLAKFGPKPQKTTPKQVPVQKVS